MWRGVIATVVVVYAYGHPAFDGYRPTSLNRAFQGLHTDINGVAESGKRALAQLDRERAKQTVRNFVGKLEAELAKN